MHVKINQRRYWRGFKSTIEIRKKTLFTHSFYGYQVFYERGYENVNNDLVPQYTFSEGEPDSIDLEDMLSLIQNMKTRGSQIT